MSYGLIYFNLEDFVAFTNSFRLAHNRDYLKAAMMELSTAGLALLRTHKAKSLGQGLYELRIRSNPELLVRVFFAQADENSFYILSVYNKKRNSSETTQRHEIQRARRRLAMLKESE